MDNIRLLELAKKAMDNSYAPYSKFSVGAALMCENGEVFTGCNIENSSFSMCICAERTAFFKALSEGRSKFKKIAVVGGKNKIMTDFCYPCGACRQVMNEFCGNDFLLVFQNKRGEVETISLADMLPKSFQMGE